MRLTWGIAESTHFPELQCHSEVMLHVSQSLGETWYNMVNVREDLMERGHLTVWQQLTDSRVCFASEVTTNLVIAWAIRPAAGSESFQTSIHSMTWYTQVICSGLFDHQTPDHLTIGIVPYCARRKRLRPHTVSATIKVSSLVQIAFFLSGKCLRLTV